MLLIVQQFYEIDLDGHLRFHKLIFQRLSIIICAALERSVECSVKLVEALQLDVSDRVVRLALDHGVHQRIQKRPISEVNWIKRLRWALEHLNWSPEHGIGYYG